MRLEARMALTILAVVGLALAGGEVRAMSLERLNLVDLLRHSTSIITGKVTVIAEGVDGTGLPYTEVTVAIDETIRGDESGTYTFRQFGLQTPRLSEDGTRMMLPAPDTFPRYGEGERVMLFLYQAASETGLRTTTGLIQGKFSLEAGRAENAMANQGLFADVSVAMGLTGDNDERMLETEIGAVNPETFTSFVQRAVAGQWVETCLLWDTVEGKTCGRTPRKDTDRADSTRTTVDRNQAPVVTDINPR